MNTSAAIADPLLRRAFGRRAHPRTLNVLLGTGALLPGAVPVRTGTDTMRGRGEGCQSPGLRAPLSPRGSAISRRTVMNSAG